MSWNYRIMAREYKEEITLAIHEVYYDEKKKPNRYSENPAVILGDSKMELAQALSNISDCLIKPILWYGDKFPEEYKPKSHEPEKQD